MIDWKKILVNDHMTVMQVIERIDSAGLQIALVVDAQQRLLGTVTDGDIRRGILRGLPLDGSVNQIMNDNPIVAFIGESRQSIYALMKSKRLRQIPVLDEARRIVRVELLDNFLEKRLYSNPVILMAGGLGTRLRPLTDNCPKPLLRLGDKPILEIILENFIEYGFYRFYISVNYQANKIIEYFGDGSKWGIEIEYIHETERLGTAGALGYLADRGINESFFVMNGDLLTKVNFERLIDYHLEHQALATMCVREYEYQVPYGVVNIDDDRLLSIEEKPTQRFFINGGLYVLHPDSLAFIPRGQYFDMPELFKRLIDEQLQTVVFPIREYWIDIGKMDDFKRANIDVEAGIV